MVKVIKMRKRKEKKNRGFTLIEILTAMTLFSLVVTVVSGLFISAIRAQRKTLSSYELLDQTSYLLEYVSRVIRMAKKAKDGDWISAGCNYEINPPGDSIKFIDYNGIWTEIYLKGDRVTKNAGGVTFELTSNKLKVEGLKFVLDGNAGNINSCQDDDIQPRVTMSVGIQGRGAEPGEPPAIQIQTTVSQRNLDVQY